MIVIRDRYFILSLIAALCATLCGGCAAVIEGQYDRVRYDGGPGALSFYDSAGNAIPSDHEYDADEGLHFNYIELDKRERQHIITARFQDRIQRDTLQRKFGYGWLLPDALLIYPFPVFAGIDILSSSIYAFPPPGVHLRIGDTSSLGPASIVTLQDVAEQRYQARRLGIALHTGLLTPESESPRFPPSNGIIISYLLGSGFWGSAGYTYSMDLEQLLGQSRRKYHTELNTIEGEIQFDPFKLVYLTAGLGFQHMIFQQAARPDDPEKRFGRNVITASFGAGVGFRSLFLEFRRNLALARIETPEGPGQYVQFTHVRGGIVVRMEPPWR